MTPPPAVLLTEAQLDVIATSFHGSPNMDIRALLGHIQALTAQRDAALEGYGMWSRNFGEAMDKLYAADRARAALTASIRTICEEETSRGDSDWFSVRLARRILAVLS